MINLSLYRNIPRSTRYVIAAKFMCSLVNASFMLILNIYLRKLGLDDMQIGNIVAFQYAGGLLLSLPEGLFLRGRRLKPFLITGAIMVPILAILVLLSFAHEHFVLGKWLLFALSMSLLQLESFTLPFIVRSGHKDSEPEAISLAYSVHSVATVFSGLIIFFVTWLGPTGDSLAGMEYLALMIMASLSIPAVFMVLLVEEKAPDTHGRLYWHNLGSVLSGYDWGLLARGLFPTSILAIGAGLTIPFINLFFNGVFGLESDALAAIGIATSGLVFITAIGVPAVRRRHGYTVAITWAQCLAVMMLILLACTELLAHVPGMVVAAVIFFMLRSPLMNMAGPMSNELVMNYVGRRNQDLAGALHASIWGGAWFVSARLFEWLRGTGIPYYQIFFMTAGLYGVAIVLYALLIRDYSRRLIDRN